MQSDVVDDILNQWSEERPELNAAPLGVVIRVMSLYRSFLREATRALEPLGLELWEYDVLSALRRQGQPFALPATALARETDLSSGAMTNRIDRLEERGLVSRHPDEEDRRSVIVSLTRQGRKVIDEAIQHRLDAASESLRDLENEELQQLAKLLRIVVLSAERDCTKYE
ncbi:MAG: MarR family transcriptional regulator [Woeseiaceae bacterium]|nr:MarR family transcriptional regulator [Woeseiaceae bacterium]